MLAIQSDQPVSTFADINYGEAQTALDVALQEQAIAYDAQQRKIFAENDRRIAADRNSSFADRFGAALLREITPDLSSPEGLLLSVCMSRCRLLRRRPGDSPWNSGWSARGFKLEEKVGRPKDLADNYPVIDRWNDDIGHISSIKSIDLAGAKYAQDSKKLGKKMRDQIDAVADWQGTQSRKPRIDPDDIVTREYELIIEPGAANLRQTYQLFKARRYAKSRGVKFTLHLVP